MASELAAQLVADRRCRIVDAGRRGRAVAELASRQRGIVARAQLLAIGFGPGAIAGRLQSGVLHSIHRGVYAVGHRALVPGAVELAAALACGRDAVVSHADAAHLYELLPYPARRTPVNITVPRESCPARPGIKAHRTRAFGLGEIGTLDGIPITSPARTILDLAAENPQQLERALAEAQARRLVTDSDLSRLLARYPGRPGSRALRRLLAGPGEALRTRSEAERRFLALVRRARLPAPESNVRLGDWEVDFLWRDRGLIVEVDGYRFHSSARAFERDRAKEAAIRGMGLELIRVSWRQLTTEPEATAASVARALGPATR